MHYHKRYLWYSIVISLFGSLFFALALFSRFFIKEDVDLEVNLEAIDFLYLLTIYLIIEISSIVFIILKWYFTTYTLTDDAIILKKGIIFKRKKTLPYNKIHAIDYKQNIIEKIFGIKKLSLDSGATLKADEVEILIIEKNTKIDQLIIDIRLKMDSVNKEAKQTQFKKDDKEYIYQYTLKDKILDAVFKSLFVFVIIVMFLSILFTIIYFFGEEQSIRLIIGFIIILIILACITFISFFLYILIRYYNYKVYLDDKYLVITHGLIKKVNNTLPLKKIKAIKVEEGLIKRIFKFCTIKLELVGFGSLNENMMINYYIPFCRKNQINKS